ncbi:hypothetical protein [Emcibacter sp. SYSU 3D8]|uniref:hypothetical protein n=1 Tax=Emcibacter sp. SYSU 3D8 TaxID=3133969 RepID=UPI0031FEBD4F
MMRKTPISKDRDPYHRRMARLQGTEVQPTLEEVIDRAKGYVRDEVWLPPVALKGTIMRLVEALEARHVAPPVAERTPAPKPAKASDAPKAPKVARVAKVAKANDATAAPTPTHRGTVHGLKGREDYEATMTLCEGTHWLDQHGRRFSASDYGYDADETYRLDLDSLKAL